MSDEEDKKRKEEEEKKKSEDEQRNIREETQSKFLDEAKKVNEERKSILDREEKLQDRKEKTRAEDAVSGKGTTQNQQPQKTEAELASEARVQRIGEAAGATWAEKKKE